MNSSYSSQSWSNPPTPIHRYRPLGGGYRSPIETQPTPVTPPTQPEPSFRNKSRKRGVVLTEAGWQKLKQAGVLYDDFGKRYTHEELSERSLLDARTVSRVISCEVKVDKRTLTAFFRAFELPLEPNDYTTPPAIVGEGNMECATVTSCADTTT